MSELTESQREYIALCGEVCESALQLADDYAKRGDVEREAGARKCAAFESQLAFAEVQS